MTTGVNGCGGGCGDVSHSLVPARHVLEQGSLTPRQAAEVSRQDGTYSDWVTDVPVQGPTDPGIRAAGCWWKDNVLDKVTDDQGAMVPRWTQQSLCVGSRPCLTAGVGESLQRAGQRVGALGAEPPPAGAPPAGAPVAKPPTTGPSVALTASKPPAPPGVWSRLSGDQVSWVITTLVQLNALIVKAGNKPCATWPTDPTTVANLPASVACFQGWFNTNGKPNETLRTDGTLDPATLCALAATVKQHPADFPTPYPGMLLCLPTGAKIGIGVAVVAVVGGTIAAIAASQSKKKRAPVNLSEARRTKERLVVITTVRDLDTWLANTRGDLTRHEREVAVEALRNSVHPRWGSDWSGWLDDHRHVVDDAVEDLWSAPAAVSEPHKVRAGSKHAPKFHRDGSVTYWSVYNQAWRRSWSVPDRELAAMPEAERRKIQNRVHAPSDNG